MEPFAILLAILFVVLPLPLCVYLIIKRGKDIQRIQNLEQQLSHLSRQPSAPQSAPQAAVETPPSEPLIAAKRQTPDHQPTLVFTDTPAPALAKSAPPPLPTAAKKPPLPRPSSHAPRPFLLPFLQSIGLWPPADALRAEAGLMQWWLPRIGGLLAALALISGAVYIGQNASPWIRFLELSLADIAVLATAVISLKKNPKFGQVLLATGLSMLYLTSIAAYAAPPVRIIDSAVVGIILQFFVIAAIFGISLLRSDRNIGIIALVYGYSSSLYSSYLGLNEAALISALSLYLAGIAINRSFNSKAILSISSIGVYAPVLSLILLKGIGSTTLTLPPELTLLGFLFISVSILPMREILKPHFDSDPKTYSKLHTLNTTLFLGLGYLYLKLFTDQLTLFYGLASLLFFVIALILGKRSLSSYLFQLFFLKAVALSALWCVNRFEGDIRWFALAVQAPIIAWVVARSRSLYQEIACFALWIVSTFLAYQAISQENIHAFTFTWYLYLAQPILAGLLFSFLHSALKKTATRTAFYATAAFINALNAAAFIGDSFANPSLAPAFLALYAIVFAGMAFTPRLSLVPAAVTSSLLALIANLIFWIRPEGLISLLAVATVAGGAAYASASYATARKQKAFALAEFAFHIAWFVSLYAFIADHFQDQLWFVFFPAAACLALLAVPAAGSRTIRDLALLPPILYLFFPQSFPLGNAAISIALLAYLAPLALTRFTPQREQDFGLFQKGEAWRIILHCIVYLVLIRFASGIEGWLPFMITLLGIALACYALWQLHKRSVALVLSLLTIAGALLVLLLTHQRFSLPPFPLQAWGTEMLIGGLLLAVTTVFASLAPGRLKGLPLSSSAQTILAYAGALVAYCTLALTLSYHELDIMAYFTPLLAFFCLLLVGIGFSLKSKPYRVIAMAGFLLPLGRLFVHDIRDTLTRIIAFAVLGILVTFIGYLYHRFQNRID